MTKTKRGALAKVVAILAVACVAIVGLLGWNWLNGLVCRSIEVSGNVHAEASEVLAIARVDTGSALFGIDPVIIADRVERHPWVQSADVTRMPASTLLIDVEERTPVLLVIDASGIPSSFLDAHGYAMPVTRHSSFDLPLITGVKLPKNPTDPVENRAVRLLAEAVAGLTPETDRLISSFIVERDGQVGLRSVPVNDQGSIEVLLGRKDFGHKLAKLRAFWHEAVITRPDRQYQLIDLRFDSQIVTRESTES